MEPSQPAQTGRREKVGEDAFGVVVDVDVDDDGGGEAFWASLSFTRV